MLTKLLPAGPATGIRPAAANRRRHPLPVFPATFSPQKTSLYHSPQTLTTQHMECSGDQHSHSAASPPPPPPRQQKRRPFCERCSKPARVCLCIRMKSPPLENSIGVTILQHSLEKKHPINSARVASLGLNNVAVVPVTDVNFLAQFTVRPLKCHGDSLGKTDLKQISNLSAVRREICRLGLSPTDSVSDDAGARLENSCENWMRLEEMGSKQDASSRGAAANGNLENFVARSKAVNGHIQIPLFQCNEEKNGFEPETTNATTFIEGNPDAHLEIFDINHEVEYPKAKGDGITSSSAECNVTCTRNHIGISLERLAKPDLSWVLALPIGKAALTNGFVVKKLQRRQLKGSIGFEDFEEFEIMIPPGSALLFPGKRSIEIGAVDFEVKHLIVLDGTWAKARRMYYENPWLKLLPHLRLDLEKESLYREVRHQPKAGCFSTIESIVCALKALEDDLEGLDSLLDVFESMIGDQRRCKDEKFSRMLSSE